MIVNDGTTTVNGLTVNGGSNGFAGTPEPGTWVMLGAGLAGLGLFELYRRKRNPAPAAA
jgi:MYXO-CTERM domain-containing protein